MTLRRKPLAAARKEVAAKSDRTIERETAEKWAARAAACYERCVAARSNAMAIAWRVRGEEYLHEALEHGALVEDFGKTVGKIEKELGALRKNARRRVR